MVKEVWRVGGACCQVSGPGVRDGKKGPPEQWTGVFGRVWEKECTSHWWSDQERITEKDLGHELPGDGAEGGTGASHHRWLRREASESV